MLPRRLLILPAIAVLLMTASTHHASAQSARDGAVSATLLAEGSGIQPGKPFTVAVRLDIDPGWHTYWINPGDSGYPTKIEWDLPAGFVAGPIQFPAPHLFSVESAGLKQIGLGYIHDDPALHLIEITPPADLTTGSEITLKARVGWLMCDDHQCVPGGVDLSLNLTVSTETPTAEANADVFAKARAALPATGTGWALAVAESGEKSLEITLTPPAGVSPPAKLAFYPVASHQIDLSAPQNFTESGGLLRTTLPKAPYFNELATPFEAVLIADSGFPMIDGRRAMLLTNAAGESPASAPRSRAAESTPTPAEVSSPAPVGKSGPFGGSLFGYLLAGFLGGIILNIMPCVFPVISLKILSFVSHAGEDRKKVLLHGGAYTVGILLFFVGLAAIVIALKIGWGGQFQSPVFVMIMTAVIVVLSLSLFGVFEIGLKMTSVGGNLTQSSGYGGSFWSGALAVILATPCTGPFLGTSLGWAMAQPAPVILVFFTTMGLGMAAPYVLLTAFPALTRRLPRPGPWMETFKQVMGFPMIAAAVYLLWILEGQIGDKGQAFFMGALVLLCLAGWAWGRFGQTASSSRRGGLLTAAMATLGAVALSIFALKQAHADQDTDSATADTRPIEEVIKSHRAAGKHVFVDFTARWCAICQTNKPAMHSDETTALFEQYGVEFVIADWTNKSDDIYQFLKKHGRRSVPYYPLFPADTSRGPLELPQNLTNGIIRDHVLKLDDVDAHFPTAN